MDSEGYHHIRIVAPDAQSWGIISDFRADPDYCDAVDIIGFVDGLCMLEISVTVSVDYNLCSTL